MITKSTDTVPILYILHYQVSDQQLGPAFAEPDHGPRDQQYPCVGCLVWPRRVHLADGFSKHKPCEAQEKQPKTQAMHPSCSSPCPRSAWIMLSWQSMTVGCPKYSEFDKYEGNLKFLNTKYIVLSDQANRRLRGGKISSPDNIPMGFFSHWIKYMGLLMPGVVCCFRGPSYNNNYHSPGSAGC